MDAPILLATDLDRTLLPNGDAPESPGARRLVARLAAHPAVTLAYVTGRDRALIEAAMAEYALPLPDYVIGDVGTSIFELRAGDWRLMAEWHQAIAPDWGGLEREALAARLFPMPGLRLQAPTRQNRFKLSCLTSPLADPAPLLERARARLAGARIKLVWSLDETAGTGMLDILPASAGKLAALEYLRARLAMPPARTLFAGDSGNDLEVLASPLPAVLVANASDALRREALALARARGTGDRLYLARGGWADMNGNYAAGILEGLAHFMPEAAAWLGLAGEE